MEIDPEIESLSKYLTVYIPKLERVDLVRRELPHGWGHLVKPVLLLDQMRYKYSGEIFAGLKGFTILNGVLKLHCRVSKEYQHLYELACKGIALESTKTCMVCGEKGARRKTEQYFPTLCTPHYVQYVNFIAEQEL